MTDHEINVHIAMRLFPGRSVHINGENVRCAGRSVNYKHPHLMERLMHELKALAINVTSEWVTVNGIRGNTLTQAVALAYINVAIPGLREKENHERLQ